MRIKTNVSSLTAQEANKNTNKNIQNSLEKLSTGLKINKASDDSSGLAIADKLRTQASSIGQGISNANSAVALIQIADKAMAEQSNILDTIKTKLIQASTSTTSEDGREAIRKDVAKLLEQFDNISGQTNYNGINLLDEKGAEFNFQVGEKSDYDISLTTAYAVNSKGLGATEEVPVDADAELAFGTVAGSVAISEDDTTLTVKNTATAGDLAVSIGGSITDANTSGTNSSFKVEAKNVESIKLVSGNSSASEVTIETDNAETIAALNALAGADTAGTNFVRISDGVYTLKESAAGTGATLDFAGGKIDLTDLKFSGVASGSVAAGTDAIVIETDEDVSVTKLAGGKDLSVDSTLATAASTLTATLVGKGSTNPEGISFGDAATDALVINSGTATIKAIESTEDQLQGGVAAVAVNAKADFATAAIDTAFEVSATNVEKMTLKMTGGTASVIINTDDGKTAASLAQIASFDENLTDLGNGTFSFTATAANADAVLDFSSAPIDISNLNFTGVQKGTNAATNESIILQTKDAVSVTKVSKEDNADVALKAYTGANASVSQAFTAITTGASSLSGSLSELKNLGEGELTSAVANKHMETIDTALTQLNSVRADFGSTQNQLESGIRNMMTVQTNVKAAESVIRDVDYAQESANFNKQNIIAQAGSYAMSQANQVQQNIMRLLQ